MRIISKDLNILHVYILCTSTYVSTVPTDNNNKLSRKV